MGMDRVCTKCKIKKDISEFGKNSKYKDGLQRQCKECINTSQRKNVIKQPQGFKIEKDGPSSNLDINNVAKIVKSLTKSYSGNTDMVLTEPTVVSKVRYDHVPTTEELKNDIQLFSKPIDMRNRRHSIFYISNIDIEGNEYVYTWNSHIKHQPTIDKSFILED